MDELRTAPLPRNAIGQFIGSPRGVRAFEDLQGDTTEIYNVLNGSSFLVLEEQPDIGNERVLKVASGELTGTDTGPNGDYTLGLADTAITPGDYGDASHLVKITFDAKGRATAAEEFELNSDNVTEGTTNLFFTEARARASLSDGVGIDYNGTTGVIALDTTDPRNVDHSTIDIVAGAGLDGGGPITADVTIDLEPSGVTAGTYASPTSITVDQYGRITAIS